MPLFRTLRELCPDKINCPAIRLGPLRDVFVQGYLVTDPSLSTHPDLKPGETVVRIPAAAAAVLLPELVEGMIRSTIQESAGWVPARTFSYRAMWSMTPPCSPS